MHQAYHLFLPGHPRHRKAHILRPPAFIIYVGFLLFLNLTFQFLVSFKPGILGFSSSITNQELADLTNKERTSHGLAPLKTNQALARAALRKGEDMFKNNYWAHVSSTGVEPWTWINQAGYDYQYAGENLAKDFAEPASIVRAWMNSPSHRDNILSDKFTDTGIAVLDGALNGYQTTLVVQMFGSSIRSSALAQAEPIESGKETPAGPGQLSGVAGRNSAELLKPAVQVETGSQQPLLDSFAIVRSASFSLVFLLLGIVGLDIIMVSRRRVVRLGSHSLAHALMLGILLIVIWYTQAGMIL